MIICMFCMYNLYDLHARFALFCTWYAFFARPGAASDLEVQRRCVNGLGERAERSLREGLV